MGMKGSYIITSDDLRGGDYLVSPNGCFCCIQWPDGNLGVYHGCGPDFHSDPLWESGYHGSGFVATVMQHDANLCTYIANGVPVWDTKTTGKASGAVYLAIEDTGNLAIYSGTYANPQQQLWQTGATDGVVDVAFVDLTYDLSKGLITEDDEDGATWDVAVQNKTSVQQTSTVSGSTTTTDTSGWKDAVEVGLAAKTSITVGIPFVDNGKIEISASLKNTYESNGSSTRTNTWSWNAPIAVPPNSQVNCLITVKTATIEVPFVKTARITYASGLVLNGDISGTYTGTNTTRLQTTLKQSVALAARHAAR